MLGGLIPDALFLADCGGFLKDVSEPYFLIRAAPVSSGGRLGF